MRRKRTVCKIVRSPSTPPIVPGSKRQSRIASSAENTPIIRPSRIRKAAKYCAARRIFRLSSANSVRAGSYPRNNFV